MAQGHLHLLQQTCKQQNNLGALLLPQVPPNTALHTVLVLGWGKHDYGRLSVAFKKAAVSSTS